MHGIGIAELGIIIYVILWLVALVDILRSGFIKQRYAFIWLLVIFLIPFGIIAYYIFGPKQKVAASKT